MIPPMNLRRFLPPLLVLPAMLVLAESAGPVSEDFSGGASRWEPTDPQAWRLTEVDGNPAFELFQQSKYEPPFRSPFNYALWKEAPVGDFEFTARVRTTKKAYGHRDMCVIFGHQDAGRFYYAHLGEKTDDHANQIFIVNGKPRVKISSKTSAGTPWKDAHWHKVKIVRRVSGLIQVFFDDMSQPVMEADDATFGAGRIGIGSFDDTGIWDDIVVRPLPGN